MTQPIYDVNPVDLTVILARANAATPGRWISPWDKPDEPSDCFGITSSDHFTNEAGEDVVSVMWYNGPHLACTEPNSAFIAASRTDIPAMAADLTRVRDGLREALDELENAYRHERSRASASAVAQVARLRALLPTT